MIPAEIVPWLETHVTSIRRKAMAVLVGVGIPYWQRLGCCFGPNSGRSVRTRPRHA
jgi:hypothetical protein